MCPTIGVDPQLMKDPPPAIKAMMDRMGVTAGQMLQARSDFVARLYRSGVRLVSGVDSGIGPAKRHGVLPYAVCELVTAGLSSRGPGHRDLGCTGPGRSCCAASPSTPDRGQRPHLGSPLHHRTPDHGHWSGPRS
ncbi:MAG: hypothetical protein ABJB47_09025 [Actinomycetota bacterium]